MSNREEFSAACAVVVPFGKYRGQTLARVGATPEGLKYLDWMIGNCHLSSGFRGSLSVYLSHPTISQQLDSLIGE